nr:hypothetical protein [Gammaproteobacteria bacterium]
FEYEATVAGQTKVREPDWPMTLGGTVTDGEVVWTARSISNASLVKTITASNWAAETGVSIEGEATENSAGEQKTAAFLIAESAGKKLSVVNTVTFSDTHKEQFRLEVTVE